MNRELYKTDFCMSAEDIRQTVATGVSGKEFVARAFGPRGWRKAAASGWAAVETAFSGAETKLLKR